MLKALIVADSDNQIVYCCWDPPLLSDLRDQEFLGQNIEHALLSIGELLGAEFIINSLVSALGEGGSLPVPIEFAALGCAGHTLRLEVHRAKVKEVDPVTIVTLSECHNAELNIADANGYFQNLDHDLLGPLTVVIGYSDTLLSMRTLGSLERNILREIRAAGHKLTNRSRRLIKVARIAARTIVLKLQPVLLADACGSALQKIKPLNGRHKFELDIPITLTPVSADSRELTEVISEILLDAMKCTPDGGKIWIKASHDSVLARNVLSISHQGTRIKSGHRNSESSLTEGLAQPEAEESISAGMGLYIARNLLEMMGGVTWTEMSGAGPRKVMFALPEYRLSEPGYGNGDSGKQG